MIHPRPTAAGSRNRPSGPVATALQTDAVVSCPGSPVIKIADGAGLSRAGPYATRTPATGAFVRASTARPDSHTPRVRPKSRTAGSSFPAGSFTAWLRAKYG